MASPIFTFPHKRLRAEVITDYVRSAGSFKGIICITCGAAGDEILKAAKTGCGDIVIIMPTEGDEWITMEQIARDYPGYFDATSGHLPFWLMVRIAHRFRQYIDKHTRRTFSSEVRVPTGSGETIFELRMAYPDMVETQLVALYDYSRGSRFESDAPLNQAVQTFFPIHFHAARNKAK